jgi:precorrin-6A synthase
MKRILVIGIGAGNPDHVTIEAIDALNRADAIFLLDKGDEKADLARLRKDILERHLTRRAPRIIEVPSPARAAPAPSYAKSVADWHTAKAGIFAALIRDELEDGACGAFLVWGDPSLYDSTLRILDQVTQASAVTLEIEVVPGVSALHLLAARHKIALNTIGEAVLITTGRKLAEAGMPPSVDTVVVLLESGAGLEAMEGEDFLIYWGAYLGTPDEVLIRGHVRDVLAEIRNIRRTCKARKGWVMDTYLLRRCRAG